MSDFALTKVIAGAFEYRATSIVQAETELPVTFTNYSPFSIHGKQDADGWIDVRGHTRLTILATALSQAGDYKVEFLQGGNDPRTNVLATNVGLAAGTTAVLYESECEHMSHIRVLHNKNGVTAGESTISVLLK